VTFKHESTYRAQFKRLVKSERPDFSSGTADHRRRTLPPTDRLFASFVFDLSHFYAIAADRHARVQYHFSKPGYSV
jgi:hypothetical protein